ncbi:SAM-dependent methyltransferase [Piscinibacter sakaiensis]|uniref:SAM-dependent methyltransferase n=1 Tax=Piscinibacter sakaiensis TaxID=1547922 RepID=UPI003AAE3BCD
MLRHLLAFLILAVAGAAAAQDDVPFVTTPDHVTQTMLELAGVGPADHLIDLGSGDGRIVITAARRFGASGQGVEIVGELVRKSRDLARRAGVDKRVEFLEQDLFETDLSRATVVTMYLLPTVNLQLRPRLLGLRAGTRIVSHDWDMGDWKPDRTRRVAVPDKPLGLDKASTLLLWIVPARVHGNWCSGDARLDLTQRFQTFSATLTRGESTVPLLVFDGRIDGKTLAADGVFGASLQVLDSGQLELRSISQPAQDLVGRRFVRSDGASCR